MTAPRSARRLAVLAARAGETVRGPILAPLPCGCVVDSEGGVWEPCGGIILTHARAMAIVRAGAAGDTLSELDGLLASIARHVDAQERAAHGAGVQGALL